MRELMAHPLALREWLVPGLSPLFRLRLSPFAPLLPVRPLVPSSLVFLAPVRSLLAARFVLPAEAVPQQHAVPEPADRAPALPRPDPLRWDDPHAPDAHRQDAHP